MPYGKVLIVDDTETNLFVARGLLALWKLNIETAQSGFEALDLVRAGKAYDIIFIDYMMPKMDGIETMQKIRELGYENAIVALTANALTGSEEMFKAHGFDGFIPKPIEIERLEAVLNKFIRDRYPAEAIIHAHPLPPDETAYPQTTTVSSQMLKAFRRDAEKAVSALREAIENGDMKFYTITVHAMKSALANVGETEKSQLAFELEKAGLGGDKDYIDTNTENFIKSLEELIKNIPDPTENISGDDENISEDTEFLSEQLQIIATACESYDNATARKAFSLLNEKTWKKTTAKTLEDIGTAIFQRSEFEEAGEKIRGFLGY
jgi:CheY-like chemotaxis protein